MHNNTLNISSGTIIRTILIGFCFYLVYILRDILLVVLTAVTITAAIEPLNKMLIKRKVPRTLSVIMIFLSLGLIIAGGFYFFLPTFISDVLGILDSLPRYVDTTNLLSPLSDTSFGASLPNLSIGNIVGSLSSTFSDVTGGLFSTISGFFGGIISFILIVVLSFYLSVQEDGVGNFLRVITPDHYEKYILDLWRRSEKKIGLWLQGQLLLGIIIGILTYLGLSILGVKSALFLALIAMVLELIPIFGIILAIIPAFAVALSDGGATLAFLVIGLYVIIQQFENHLIYPLVVRKIVGIPPILVILTLIIGLKLAGFIGVILSVPVAAILVEVLNDIEKKKGERITS
ncbi:MAG: AI-2E family transporter [bacterium]